jgi:hypothetical protein
VPWMRVWKTPVINFSSRLCKPFNQKITIHCRMLWLNHLKSSAHSSNCVYRWGNVHEGRNNEP